MRAIVTAVVVWSLWTGLAQAQARRSDDNPLAALGLSIAKPLSAEDAAAVRARVDAAIAALPQGAFVNASDAYSGQVKHLASGLTCGLGQPGQSVQMEGTDTVVCRNAGGDGRSEARVSLAPRGATLASMAAAAAAQVRREPGYAPYSGLVVNSAPKPGSGLPEHRTLRFTSRIDGASRFTRLRLGIIGGWLLTERQTGPQPKAGEMTSMTEAMAEAMFGSNLKPPSN